MGCTQSEISPQTETPKKCCTDVLWLLICIIFWVLMLIVAAISFVYGDPHSIINGVDSFGNVCGVKTNLKLKRFPYAGISTLDKPYLFFLSLNDPRTSIQICVKKCPNKKLVSPADIQKFYNETHSNLCFYNVELNELVRHPEYQLNEDIGPCPALPVYESIPLVNRCIPKYFNEVSGDIYYWGSVQQMMTDLYSSRKEMITCVIIAFLCSLIIVSTLHLLATVVSWIFMIVVSIVSVAGTALLWSTYYEIKSGKQSFAGPQLLSETLKNETAFLWYSIIATTITLILLLLVFVMRSRVNFLAQLFRETAHCLGSIPALFLQPIVTFLFLVLFFAFWFVVVIYLASAVYLDEFENSRVTWKSWWAQSTWWMFLVCLLWGSEFILGCQQMTIAGAVSHWYFRGEQARYPVLYSIGKLIVYHLGSVAKGSFLITLFKVPRLILTYLHAKLSARAEKGSKCAKRCVYCLEKFIRNLNHNAYTIITIESCHFSEAAAKAFSTIVNNALQVATINSVGDFILFLGKCIVTAVTGIIGLLLVKRNPDLHFFAIPTLVICIYSFFIAHCILSLYETVLDSLFLCVCEDNNGDGRWKNARLAKLGHTPADGDTTDSELCDLLDESSIEESFEVKEVGPQA